MLRYDLASVSVIRMSKTQACPRFQNPWTAMSPRVSAMDWVPGAPVPSFAAQPVWIKCSLLDTADGWVAWEHS
jgi:hypothetical protein